MAKHPTTIAEIASLADVSKTTVSMVLNGKGRACGISEKTIQRISDLIKKHDYHPNHAARSLSNGSSKCIGFISGAIHPYLLSELIDAAESHGYRMMAMLTKWDIKKELDCIEMALAHTVDGLIIYGQTLNKESEARLRLQQKSMPTIVMGTKEENGFPRATNDFTPGMRQAFEEFSTKGYRRIALLHMSVNTWKLEPYLEQCKAFGYEPLDLLFANAEPDDDLLSKSCQTIRELRPDAIIVEDAICCIRTIERLSALGLRIPQDLSVVCISGEGWLDYCNYNIAILDYDLRENARQAVAALVSLIDGGQAPASQLADTFLRRPEAIIDRKCKGGRPCANT